MNHMYNNSCTSTALIVQVQLTALRKYVHAINKQYLAVKTEKFIRKKREDICSIFAQNIDCWYKLEPPSEAVLTSTLLKIVYPTSQFHYIKVGFKGVYIPWTCFPDNDTTLSTSF